MTSASIDQLRDSILQAVYEPLIPTAQFHLKDYGCDPSGKTDNAPAFAKAIEAVREAGGGTLQVAEGSYRMEGPLHLCSKLCLHLEAGANIRFVSQPDSYLPPVLSSWEGTFLYNYSPLIYGRDLEDVCIRGAGSIGILEQEPWKTWRAEQQEDQMRSRQMNNASSPLESRVFGKGYKLRPPLLQLLDCHSVFIEGITVQDSPFWCLHFLRCENVILRSLKYHAFCVNNDGIDLEYCRDVLIEDIDFDNGDDNVAIKAGRDTEGRANAATPSCRILVRNCRFKGLHAIVIGSEMSAGVHSVVVEDCEASGYLKRGVYIKSNADRGGYIRDIFVRNLHLADTEDCIYITSYYFNEGAGHETDIRNISIENLSAHSSSSHGIVVQGYPTKPVENIQLSNIRIGKAQHGMSMTNARQIICSNIVIGDEAGAPSHA